MDLWIALIGAVLALAVGVWIGVGAPGWPHEPRYYRQHDSKRDLNPIKWSGKSSSNRHRKGREFGEGLRGRRRG